MATLDTKMMRASRALAEIPTVNWKRLNASSAVDAIPSFIVPPEIYRQFMSVHRLHEVLEGLLVAADPTNLADIEPVAAQMKTIICNAPLAPELKAPILESYLRLGRGKIEIDLIADRYVMAYSRRADGKPFSRTARTAEGVIAGVKACWATLFEARAIFYRILNDLSHQVASVSVLVQRVGGSQYNQANGA